MMSQAISPQPVLLFFTVWICASGPLRIGLEEIYAISSYLNDTFSDTPPTVPTLEGHLLMKPYFVFLLTIGQAILKPSQITLLRKIYN
jgi:hypothetical protein